jgi:tetratricopeptide (TPR) repeat protein
MMTPLPCLDEETATAFAEGRLAPDALAEVEGHAATCALCRSLVAAALGTRTRRTLLASSTAVLAEALPAPAALPMGRGTYFGRYTLLGLTGKGGMGEVYAAYDVELDRRVALKLLHARGGQNDQRYEARLLREARAMAKVSHPNVVAVHDVGTIDGRVFVAMDFVDGVTLKEWLATGPRPREEIVSTFVMAARGLDAAHAAGLVHRDFKPQNVMVARNGAVRVMDFGLVSSMGDAEQEVDAPAPFEASSGDDVHLTRTGELVGTPLYMAPEQFRGAPTGPRTDQFAFCVALYQALFGESPFEDKNLRVLVANVLAGQRRPPPAGAAVPGWLRQVVARGLSVDADKRWPSMRDLIAALEHDPVRARKRGAAIAGGALLAGLSAVALAHHALRPNTLCQGGSLAIAAAWPAPARREAVHTAFDKSGAPSVGEVWERVAAGLDRYVERWTSTYREACEATQRRHEQPAATLDLRMACLGERRTALAALTGVLAAADRDTVQNAVDAVRALPPLETCSDVKQLSEAIEAPRDAATRERVQDLRGQLAVATALADAGKNDEAHRRASLLVSEARQLAYTPLLAESLATLSHSHAMFTNQPADTPAREEAVWTGIAVNRFDLAADAAILVYSNVGTVSAERGRAQLWEGIVNAVLDRLGSSAERQRSWMLQGQALRHFFAGEATIALEIVQRTIALKQRLGLDDGDVGISVNTQADALQALGRTDEALAVNQRAYELLVRAYGEGSQAAAFARGNRGEYLVAAGRPEEALAPLRDCLANLEQHLPPDGLPLAYPLTSLGRAHLALGRPAEAVRFLERALRIRQGGKAEPSLIAETSEPLARARRALERP